MKEDYIKNKLGNIYDLVNRIDDRVKPKREMSDEVKHSIIWATTLILLAIIIKWMII